MKWVNLKKNLRKDDNNETQKLDIKGSLKPTQRGKKAEKRKKNPASVSHNWDMRQFFEYIFLKFESRQSALWYFNTYGHQKVFELSESDRKRTVYS